MRSPAKAKKHYDQGMALFEKGKLVDASFEFDKALELDSEKAAILLRKLGKPHHS